MKYNIFEYNTKNIIYVNLSINFGTDNESEEEMEYAHIVEHLFCFFTSKKYPNYKQVHQEFNKLGITYAAETHSYVTKYIFTTHKDNLKFLLDVLFETINNFQIDKSIFEQEKNSVIIELKNFKQMPDYLLNVKISELFFPNHSRSIPLLKRIKNTQNCTIKDIMRFFKKHYKSNNLFFSFCGDLKQHKKYLNNLFNFNVSPFKEIKINYNHINKTRISRVPRKDSQSFIKLCFKIDFDSFNDNNYILEALLEILCGNLNSLLYVKLRSELGLIYFIESNNNIDEYKNMSYIIFNTTTNDKKYNIKKIVNIIFDILFNLTEQQLEKHLNYFKVNNKINIIKEKNCKSGGDMLDFYDNYILFNKKLVNYFDYMKNYNKVTAKNIVDLSKQIFRKDNYLLVYSSNNKFNNELSI